MAIWTKSNFTFKKKIDSYSMQAFLLPILTLPPPPFLFFLKQDFMWIPVLLYIDIYALIFFFMEFVEEEREILLLASKVDKNLTPLL